MRMNVSVIIPAYNAAGTLAVTLESLFKQTFRNWEVIVFDNGSNDETQAVATSFTEKHHRIRVVNESQKRVSIARNTGIRTAHFDRLLFLDADDWILPQHLERMTYAILSANTLITARKVILYK
jgi:glycosyltransferase involved in cell wall biosynthesis